MGNSHDWRQTLTAPYLTLGSTVTVHKTHSRAEMTPVKLLEAIEKFDILTTDQVATIAAAANQGLVEKHTQHIHFVLTTRQMEVRRIDCWMSRLSPLLLDVQIMSVSASVPFSKVRNKVITRDGEIREKVALPVGATSKDSEMVSKLLSLSIEHVAANQPTIPKNTIEKKEVYSVPRTLATWKGASMEYELDEKQKAALQPLYLWVHNSHRNWILSFSMNRKTSGFVWDWSLASSAPIGRAYKTQVKDSIPVYLYQAPSGGKYYRLSTDGDANDPVFKTQQKGLKPWFWVPTKGAFVIVEWRSEKLIDLPTVSTPPPVKKNCDANLSLFLA